MLKLSLFKHPQVQRAWPYLTLLLWVLPLLLFRSSQQSLVAHDEGVYAAHAHSILHLNNWLAPQFGGTVNYDRTIGIQWLIAVCYLLFGMSEDTARLPSTVAFIASVWLVYAIGSRLLNPKLAWLGAAIFAVTPISLEYGRAATQDAVLVCLELVGVWALLQAEQGDRRRPYWSVLAGSTFGLGFLIKGFMIIPAAIALFPYLIWRHRQHRQLTNPWLYLGLLLGLIPVVAWFGLSTLQYGSVPFQHLFGKFFYLKDNTFHDAGPFYYFWNIPVNAFPWALFGLVGGVLLVRSGNLRSQGQTTFSQTTFSQTTFSQTTLLLLAYPALLFIELTLFGTRTRYYPLQLLPFLALMAAVALDRCVSLFGRKDRSGQWILALLSYGFGGLAVILLLVGLGTTTGLIRLDATVVSPEELQQYGWITLALGLGWLALPIVWFRHSRSKEREKSAQPFAQQWLASWLMGAWLALAMVGLTGAFGNYSPDLKTFLERSDIATVLNSHPVNFVVQENQLNEDGSKTFLLLNFYTPDWQKFNQQPDQLKPGDYSWIAPNLAIAPSPRYHIIGTVRGWQLVQVR